MMIASRGSFARVLPSVLVWAVVACSPDETTTGLPEGDVAPADLRRSDIEEGREIFRFDTFGNETFWTDSVGLHNVVNNLSPLTALTVAGLKVDSRALPDALRDQIREGDIDLDDPSGLDMPFGIPQASDPRAP